MGIPNEARSSRHVERYASYHLAAIKAEPAAAHSVAPTEQLLTALRSAEVAHAAAEQAEVEEREVVPTWGLGNRRVSAGAARSSRFSEGRKHDGARPFEVGGRSRA